MIKRKIYRYIGLNGSVMTDVILEGVPHTTTISLTAEPGFYLTDGKIKVRSISFPENTDISMWEEVPDNLEKFVR